MSPQQKAAQSAGEFVERFNNAILFPTITLLTAVAFLVFIWGCVEYFINSTNETARQQGVRHITFGIIGLVIMLSAFAILSFVANTANLEQELNCANNPSDSRCNEVFVVPGGSGGPGSGGNSSGGQGSGGNSSGGTGSGGGSSGGPGSGGSGGPGS